MAVTAEPLPSFLVYGPHGAGLGTALQAFREVGYMTSAGVSPAFVERLLMVAESEEKPLVITLDLNPYALTSDAVQALLADLKGRFNLKLLYLSAPTPVLIQRFAEADKVHPYETQGLKGAVDREQHLYQPLKSLSDYHVDTSSTTPTELALKIAKVLKLDVKAQPMTLHLVSFGFKNGLPPDAEMVFDMRFLPNPFYDEALRPYSGMDKPVSDYVMGFPESQAFLQQGQALLGHLLPLYQKQGKIRMTIAIGCTGGQHRSVAMTLALSGALQAAFPDYTVQVLHRERNHWPQPTALASPTAEH